MFVLDNCWRTIFIKIGAFFRVAKFIVGIPYTKQDDKLPLSVVIYNPTYAIKLIGDLINEFLPRNVNRYFY